MPRNPNIIRFFRHPKLSENAGYGIDKIVQQTDFSKSKVERTMAGLRKRGVLERVGSNKAGSWKINL